MAKVTIPDALKADVPQTIWGKILTATPIIMTVVATALAGLASSEMTRGQFYMSLAGQRQAKASDQWAYFQAKRLRSAIQRNALDILRATTEIHPLDVATVDKSVDPQTLAALQHGQLPPVPAGAAVDAKVKAALDAMAATKPDPELAALILPLSATILVETARAADDRATAFDKATQPVNQTIDRLEGQLAQPPANQVLIRDFVAARLRYTANRYDAEARLNQATANIYELEVRHSNLVAERHQKRSKRFFFGMLAAQAAVIISTFAIATQRRSLLWSLAAAAGAAAIAFAVYVYLFV